MINRLELDELDKSEIEEQLKVAQTVLEQKNKI